MLAFFHAQTSPEDHNLLRLLHHVSLQVIHGRFANLWDVLCDGSVCYCRNLFESLQRVILYLLVVHKHRSKNPVHNKVALVFVEKVFSSRRNSSLERLDCDTRQFNFLVVSLVLADVADHCMKDFPYLH